MTPDNGRNPILDAEHFRLSPADRQANKWASACPACHRGTLGVVRDPDSLLLLEYDRCLSCGQAVRYVDVEDMRRKDWVQL